ncbi:MAG: zinc ribbon domain-containing protein [Alphaproteobacteria bacterium]|nr:zinc ribbon domain-containing protein [Alphaproteobacteria bacterium]
MPLYDYECETCGPFRAWRSMSAYRRPAPCPDCGRSSRRAVVMPALGMDSGQRNAHAVNEKSANEPRVVRRRRGDDIPRHDAHADLMRARGDRAAQTAEPHKAHTHHAHHPWMLKH